MKKWKDIFTYGKPAFMSDIAAGLGSKKRANWFILVFLICSATMSFLSLNKRFEFIPHPLYKEDVEVNAKSLETLPHEDIARYINWYTSLPTLREKPWYDIFDFTGRYVRHAPPQI